MTAEHIGLRSNRNSHNRAMHLEPTMNGAESGREGQPLVSVIVPTYNYGALIAETLERLQRQTLANWECIAVDDGSTDHTAEVVARGAAKKVYAELS
jgi:cellulose synthase/poly-beta-1,6-N-acetylglucosamine synthase-like glycosyltransferase